MTEKLLENFIIVLLREREDNHDITTITSAIYLCIYNITISAIFQQ